MESQNTTTNALSTWSISGLVDQMTCLRIEEARCMELFRNRVGEDKHSAWESAKQCRDELERYMVELDRRFPDQVKEKKS
jgi:hypothetical protein